MNKKWEIINDYTFPYLEIEAQNECYNNSGEKIIFFDNYFVMYNNFFNLNGENLNTIIGTRNFDYHEKRNSGSEFVINDQDYCETYDKYYEYEYQKKVNFSPRYPILYNVDVIEKKYLVIYTMFDFDDNPWDNRFNFIKDFNGNTICDGFDECGMFNQDYIYTRKKNIYSFFPVNNPSNFQNFSVKEIDNFNYAKPYFNSDLVVFKNRRCNSFDAYSYIEIYNFKGELILTLKELLNDEIKHIIYISDFYNNVAFVHSDNENVYALGYDVNTNKINYIVQDGKKYTFKKETFTPSNQCYKFQEGFAFVRFKDNEFDSIINTNYEEVFRIEYL